MADPLDSLYRPENTAEPEPQFRAELMNRLGRELQLPSSGRPDGNPNLTDQTPDVMEIVMPTQLTPRRSRQLLLTGLGLVSAAAAIIALVVVNRDDSQPAATVAPTTVATTTSTLTDAAIANTAVLTRNEVGAGYQPRDGFTFNLDRAAGPGSNSPACAPFLDTVFESPQRPATVKIQHYEAPGSRFQQYIVVFPDESGAVAMMTSIADASFPACIAAVLTEYTSDPSTVVSERTPFIPVPGDPLTPVGDEMTVIRLHSTFQFRGSTFDDANSIPFVRVGHVVVWMNPNSAKNLFNTPGYSDDQLQNALSIMTAHLRAAQGG